MRAPPTASLCIVWRLWLLALTGCAVSCRSVHFYTQAAAGQWEIVRKARPIGKVMSDPALPPQTRGRLALVQELREFAARELRLPADRQYDRFSDLGRPYVVWVVFAAPEFSTEAKTWSYPLLGKLKYRGWFSEKAAKSEAESLRRAGYDVTAGGTEAYSTLGWFRDPVLNTFLSRNDAELAELLFHELTHHAVFIKGDTDFNEALATAVGQHGARLWLRSKGRLKDLDAYEKRLRLRRQVTAAMLRTKDELTALYAAHLAEPPENRRALKAAAFARLRQETARLRALAGVKPPKQPPPLNNASLNSVASYYGLLPAMERRLGECGSIPAFLEQIKSRKAHARDWLHEP